MAPDVTWNELHPAAPHKARTICTQRVFSTINVDKRIREPAWAESGRRASADGILEYLANERTHQTWIDPPKYHILGLSGPALTQRFEIRWKSQTRSRGISPLQTAYHVASTKVGSLRDWECNSSETPVASRRKREYSAMWCLTTVYGRRTPSTSVRVTFHVSPNCCC